MISHPHDYWPVWCVWRGFGWNTCCYLIQPLTRMGICVTSMRGTNKFWRLLWPRFQFLEESPIYESILHVFMKRWPLLTIETSETFYVESKFIHQKRQHSKINYFLVPFYLKRNILCSGWHLRWRWYLWDFGNICKCIYLLGFGIWKCWKPM